MGTVLPDVSDSAFATRLAALIPRGWANDSAKQSGGVLYALLDAIGTQFEVVQNQAIYALGSTRIQTAAAPELDDASKDFLGSFLPRPNGMSDANYSALIISNLLPNAVTRNAISGAIQALTGVAPRIVEPWNPADTGAWDIATSYWDVTTAANPFVWTDAVPEYYAFVTTIAPPITALNGNALTTWDDGCYFDTASAYGMFFTDAAPATGGIQQLYQLINKVKAEGTTIWVQIVPTLN